MVLVVSGGITMGVDEAEVVGSAAAAVHQQQGEEVLDGVPVLRQVVRRILVLVLVMRARGLGVRVGGEVTAKGVFSIHTQQVGFGEVRWLSTSYVCCWYYYLESSAIACTCIL